MKYPKDIPLLIVIGLLFGTYLPTMATGLTWANHGSDGGDLITAAFTQGVAHPTGYPVYLLLASVFQKLPIGTLAYRTNLFSAIVVALSAVFVYKIIQRVTGNWLSSLVASLTYAWIPIIWSQAVITEVYGLHACFFSILVYMVLRPNPFDSWFGFVLGLSIGNHITSILLFPVIIIMYILASFDTLGESEKSDTSLINRKTDAFFFIAGLGCGLIPYLLLPMRSLSASPILWGDSSSALGFLWMVSGQMYRENLLPLSFASPSLTIYDLFYLMIAQFGLMGLSLILLGIPSLMQYKTLSRMTMLTSMVFILFAVNYKVINSHIYLIPMFLSMSLWMGLGVYELINFSRQRGWQWMACLVGIICVIYLGWRLSASWKRVDASKDMRAELYGRMIMDSLPVDAIVFANGDRSTFALWYFHFALGRRSDVRVVASGLLEYDWYRANLQNTYPDITITKHSNLTWINSFDLDNPDRPICHTYYERQPYLYCDDTDTP